MRGFTFVPRGRGRGCCEVAGASCCRSLWLCNQMKCVSSAAGVPTCVSRWSCFGWFGWFGWCSCGRCRFSSTLNLPRSDPHPVFSVSDSCCRPTYSSWRLWGGPCVYALVFNDGCVCFVVLHLLLVSRGPVCCSAAALDGGVAVVRRDAPKFRGGVAVVHLPGFACWWCLFSLCFVFFSCALERLVPLSVSLILLTCLPARLCARLCVCFAAVRPVVSFWCAQRDRDGDVQPGRGMAPRSSRRLGRGQRPGINLEHARRSLPCFWCRLHKFHKFHTHPGPVLKARSIT